MKTVDLKGSVTVSCDVVETMSLKVEDYMILYSFIIIIIIFVSV